MSSKDHFSNKFSKSIGSGAIATSMLHLSALIYKSHAIFEVYRAYVLKPRFVLFRPKADS
jgi:hypothetical protein